MGDLKAKTVVVTGANRGLGRAISEGLAERGCHVYLATRAPGKADEAIEQIRSSGGQATELILDVSSPESIANAVDTFCEKESSLDILINNAGIFIEDKDDSILDIPTDTYEEEFQINVLGPLLVTNGFYVPLKSASHARVINMSSLKGQLSDMDDPKGGVGYCISKAALNVLTRKQAAEFAAENIDVNCMSPGWVRTDMGGSEANRSLEEGADTAIWLALDNSTGNTGLFYQDRKNINW